MTPSTPNQDPFSGGMTSFSALEILVAVRQRWIPGVALGLVCALAVGYWMSRSDILYESNASLMVETSDSRILTNMEEVGEVRRAGAALINTHIVRLNSRQFAERVARELTDDEKSALIEPFLDPENPGFTPNVVSVLRTAFSVYARSDSQVLVFNVQHPTPAVAVWLPNRYAEIYLHYLDDLRSLSSEHAISFLREQVDAARQEVEIGEEGLNTYRQEHNVISMIQSQQILTQELQTLNAASSAAELSVLEMDAELQQIREAGDDVDSLARLFVLTETAVISELVERLEALREERKMLSRDYLQRHPRMIENANRQEAASRQLLAAIDRRTDSIQNRIDATQTRIRRLHEQIETTEARVRELDSLAIQYSMQEREVQSKRNTYARLVDRLDEALVVSRLESSSLRMMDPSVYSWMIGQTSQAKIGLAAFVVFSVCLIGLPLILDLMDHRMRTVLDVERMLAKPLLGLIREFERGSVSRGEKSVFSDDNEVVESFRMIYGNFVLENSFSGPVALVVSSSLPSEGKTFVVANLGAILARHGKKVVLIDTDLRRPSLARLMQQRNELGLLAWYRSREGNSGVVEDPLSEESLGVVNLAPNLDLIPSGGSTKSPTEALSSDLFDVLISACRERYDIILFDTPPVGVFPDATLLGPYCEGAIFVVRQKRVDRSTALSSVQRLDTAESRVLGVVLNAVSSDPAGGAGQSSYGSYGAYGYTEKYRKAYAEEIESKEVRSKSSGIRPS
ncbi:MAG: polysaccharide biosynthesis tyrosine autokinase [Puniceicoccaceae bacterium]|nr:MAG: polysaccharide biosynthesis tyrosine autokinase [Puniceicoccaceae bacterium]